ncbi:MAG: amidohydrolase family protein [Dongiaceae bacterium]
MAVLIRNARVLTMDDHETELDRADILVEGSKIAAIGRDLRVPNSAPLRIIDASYRLAMPGLINGHFHSPGNFMKGFGFDQPLELYMLFEVPPISSEPASKRLNYVRTMVGVMEMIRNGTTSVYDDTNYNPYPTMDAIDGTMEAYRDAGFRATVTLSNPNVIEYDKFPFLKDLLPAHLRRAMEERPNYLSTGEMVQLYRSFLDRWHGQNGNRLHVGMSISAPQRVTRDYFQALMDLSLQRDLAFSLHILETKTQRVLGEENYGKSLIRYVSDLGFLNDKMTVIHSIWVDEMDMRAMAASGCSVAHNPVCNLKIGSGIMPFRRLRDHGINICLGADEMGADDSCNMWGVVKQAGLIHRISQPDYNLWPSAQELLWCLTRGGARAMNRARDIGAIAPGYEADIILVDLETIPFTPLNDLRRQLVYCETGSSVVMTMIGGQVVYENGRIETIDEKAILAEARELIGEYRAEVTRAGAAARELEPYYREMYFRAAARDVGLNRWAGPMVP